MQKLEPFKLVPLLKSDKFQTKGWNIDFEQLLTFEGSMRSRSNNNDLFESLHGEYCCFMYNIIEHRMGSYSGFIGIYKNKENPELISNPEGLVFEYQELGRRTLTFINSTLFLRLEASNNDPKLSGYPFIAVDLVNKEFRFIDFDRSAYYYSPIWVNGTIYRFKLDTPKELENKRYQSRDGEAFDLSKKETYPLSNLRAFEVFELYKNEKRNANNP